MTGNKESTKLGLKDTLHIAVYYFFVFMIIMQIDNYCITVTVVVAYNIMIL